MSDTAANIVVSKMKAIKLAAEALAERTNDLQLIRAFLNNRIAEGFVLSEKQTSKLERYQFAYNQLASGKYTMSQVAAQIEKHFNVRQSQAYEDITDSKEIYAGILTVNKAFEISVQIEGLKLMQQKALMLNDTKGYAACSKALKGYLELIPEEEEKTEDFDGHTYNLEFNPALIGAEEVNMKEVLEYINAKRDRKINLALFEEANVIDGTEPAL